MEFVILVSLPYIVSRYEADVACKWILEKKGLTGYQVRILGSWLNVERNPSYVWVEYISNFQYTMKFEFLRYPIPIGGCWYDI